MKDCKGPLRKAQRISEAIEVLNAGTAAQVLLEAA